MEFKNGLQGADDTSFFQKHAKGKYRVLELDRRDRMNSNVF